MDIVNDDNERSDEGTITSDESPDNEQNNAPQTVQSDSQTDIPIAESNVQSDSQTDFPVAESNASSVDHIAVHLRNTAATFGRKKMEFKLTGKHKTNLIARSFP